MDGITNSTDMSLGKLWGVGDGQVRERLRAGGEETTEDEMVG